MQTVPPVTRPSVVSLLPLGSRRAERLARMGREREAPAQGGRAWINGREVGGADPRFAHLARSFD